MCKNGVRNEIRPSYIYKTNLHLCTKPKTYVKKATHLTRKLYRAPAEVRVLQRALVDAKNFRYTTEANRKPVRQYQLFVRRETKPTNEPVLLSCLQQAQHLKSTFCP